MTFNEGARLDPSRVQRRGRGSVGKGGVAAGGVGIVGILIAMLYMFLGVDPDQAGSFTDAGTDPNDPATQQDFEARCVTGADANLYADCRVAGAVNSLDAYWEVALPAAGVEFSLPGVVVFEAGTSTGCGQASSATGPFYCPPDQTMYVDTGFWDVLTGQLGASGGPLAEMYVIAHEYGHHLQALMGVFDIADRSGSGPDSDAVKVELMADCLAGVWAGHASTVPDESGVPYLAPITEQDLEDALSAAASVGDDRIQEAVQGHVEPHKFTHGTSAQRQAAFMEGFNTMDVRSCDLFNIL